MQGVDKLSAPPDSFVWVYLQPKKGCLIVVKERPTVGLALGAGAARGFAHLGVLRVLKDANIPIDLVAGSSIGSVFGALFALGSDLEMLTGLALQLKPNFFMDPCVPRRGLISGRKAHALLRLLTKNKTFSDLEKDLYVVAVDIENGDKVVFEDGLLADALRASISVPGVFQPFNLNGRLFVDGAVMDRIPVSVLRDKGADIVVAVDVKLTRELQFRSRINNIFDVFFQSLDLLEREVAKHHLIDADVLIYPDVGDISAAAFNRVGECIDRGAAAARDAVPRIKEAMGERKC